MDDEEVKKRILARRALFVAGALAGMSGIACDARPFACLEPPPPEAGVAPQPCLSETIVPTVADAGAVIEGGAPMEAGTVDASPDAASPAPKPCLSMTVPKRDAGVVGNGTRRDAGALPRVCLSEM